MSTSHDQIQKYFIDLPLSRLHVMETGGGPPLIIVPATISELREWETLTRFMGQWFRAFFFELPGHGGSSPFPAPFSSYMVAEMVESLADHLGFERFNLMGFSFGGILAMRTFHRLSARIDRLLMIAPCLGSHCLAFSPLRRSLLKAFTHIIDRPAVQRTFYNLVHDPGRLPQVVSFFRRIGRLEENLPLEEKFARIQPTTIKVLSAQVKEILVTEFGQGEPRFQTPCYFAMSTRDPMLHFDLTLAVLEARFESITTLRLSYPFHQAPRPFTFEELNRDFGAAVDSFMQARNVPHS